MSTHQRNCLVKGEWGVLYLFDDPGDGLTMHKHDTASAHSVEVLGGSALVYGLHGESKVVLEAGQTADIEWSKWHEIRALAPQTVIFNKYLNGYPPEYVGLADEHLWANLVPALTHDLLADGTVQLKPEYAGVFEGSST